MPSAPDERQRRAEWASISLNPAMFEEEGLAGVPSVSAFTNADDPFITAMLCEFARLIGRDGTLDETYCDAMSWALARHMLARYGKPADLPALRSWKLPPWRLRRLADHVEANIAEPIRIADLAAIAGLSAGYFHRAFRATTGQTPLEFVNAHRIRRAIALMRQSEQSLAAIALMVGFTSPSHFTRTFRQVTGANPTAFRTGAVASRPVDAGSS